MTAKGVARAGNYAPAQYEYPGGDKHPHEWIICEECSAADLAHRGARFCSRSCSKLGVRNPVHQKNGHHGLTQVEYVRLHRLVRRARGKASRCANGCEATVYHWANISGDYYDVWDFQEMCPHCHDAFDRAKNMPVGVESAA